MPTDPAACTANAESIRSSEKIENSSQGTYLKVGLLTLVMKILKMISFRFRICTN